MFKVTLSVTLILPLYAICHETVIINSFELIFERMNESIMSANDVYSSN